ncbi:uncharacterized protein LOC117569625 [Drosophila albomicans]|uniref:Uncharacterized protein LOC117569625 n=1 Tax=Drosophila albomicans TaxID=7291 RepID=A0A6P8X4Q7_DROAB|nr:uncharacterized protein LOC117569625 [Drosophila albomicans]
MDADDASNFEYIPEVEQNYSEAETEAALKFLKEQDLPMSELYYALKYVRLANRDLKSEQKFKEIEERLKKLREADIPMVSPPSSDYECED